MTDDKIKERVQKADPGKIVNLYDLDATNIGAGQIYHFTTDTVSGVQNVVFGGVTYAPINIEIDGMEFQGQNTLPRPKVRISNVSKVLAAEVINLDDLIGAKLTRTRTFQRYLDHGTDPDQTATFSSDIYVVERKTAHNKYLIEWELAAYMDFEGTRIPRRQVIKDVCIWRYRYYDPTASGATASGFVNYDPNTVGCPYDVQAPPYWDEDGNETTNPNLDRCGKRLSDCEYRFSGSNLPFGGFPSVAETRIHA